MDPAALLEFAIRAAEPLESPAFRVDTQRAPCVRAHDLRDRTLAPGLRRLTRERQAEQHRAQVDAQLGCCVAAVAEAERRGWSRRGPRAQHVARLLDEWSAWGAWLGTRNATGVGIFLASHLDRPVPWGPLAGWCVRRLESTDSKVRYGVWWHGLGQSA